MPSQLFPAPLPLKPRRFTSRALFVVFRTETDLSPWVPAPVVLADPHVGIFKVWRTKSRFLGEDPDPLLMSQFEEAVIGVLAAVPGSPQRHYNLLNLHSQPWAVGRGNPLGHRLRHATIEMTWTFPQGPEFDLDTAWRAFDVDVHRLGTPIACFRGALGETAPRFPEPDYNGFLNVSFQTGGDGRLSPPIVVEDTLADLTLGRVTYGGGQLEFFGSPDDSPVDAALLSALGTVEVLGCALRDLGWTRNFPEVKEVEAATRRTGMTFWVNLATFGDDLSPDLLRDTAQAAEAHGFEGVLVPDHVLLPASADPGFGAMIESLMTLSFLAGQTSRVRLGTSVLVAPLRNPVVLAKQVAALDVLSAGRAVIGLSAGWSVGEFANVGVPFGDRGRRADEAIALLRHLFSGVAEPFLGEFTTLTDYVFAPLPPQGAQLPILIGGDSAAALRRAATLGDLWQGSTMPLDRFATLVARLRELAGNRTVSPGVETRYGGSWGTAFEPGRPASSAAYLSQFRDAGCERVSVGFRPGSAGLTLMEEFCSEVLPLVE